jgi:hypothetical protein
MIDWSACPAVERSADTLSGAWRFKNTAHAGEGIIRES